MIVTSHADARRFEERTDPSTGEAYLAVNRRGIALKDDPLLNKGTCFTLDERRELGLSGLIPPAVSTPEEQAGRAYENYSKAATDVDRYVFLAGVQDRNETLFHRLLHDHLEEMIPVVYTPTVGQVCERYSHIYRRPRGVYISAAERGRMVQALENADRDDTQVIVVTDNEAILGIGDQGVGGMGIAIGKLALYTAAAGIHPARTLPIDLDVGTDNPALLNDPLYLGVRQPRLRGIEYFALLDELVDAITKVFPHALVQWEDFANERAFEVLGRYRRRLLSFDDDIQGTGAVVEAGVRTALDRVGRRLDAERVLFYGAGASGAGCALQVRSAMRRAGVPEAEVGRRVLCFDRQGPIFADRPGLGGHKQSIAADPSLANGWTSAHMAPRDLLDVVRNFRPTILVGVSGQPGSFTEPIIGAMQAHCPRPIVFALSNPTSKIEARPDEILRWTNGAAIVATGSPCPPVRVGNLAVEIGQCNNVLVFPGIGLGATAVEANWLPDEAFAAAASALHGFTAGPSFEGASIFPRLTRLREISRAVAVAVGQALVASGAAPARRPSEVEERVASRMWEPVYQRYRAGWPDGDSKM